MNCCTTTTDAGRQLEEAVFPGLKTSIAKKTSTRPTPLAWAGF
jgi:hypothetical protein